MSHEYAAESLNIDNREMDTVTAGADSESVMFAATDDMKTKAMLDLREVLAQLEKSHPGITEGQATALGAGAGAAGALTALSSMGAVSGLSAAGVTTGLSAAGGLLGGGMLLGIGVLATPVAALGIVGYSLAKKRKKDHKAAALGQAAKRICDIQSSLMPNQEYFKDEIAYIKSTLEILTSAKTV